MNKLLLSLLLTISTQVMAIELISAEDLLSLIQANKAPAILDVRSANEYNNGHVPGAMHIPHSEISAQIDKLAAYKDKTLVVYCRSGYRAGIAENELSQRGFKLLHLQGDWQGWQASRLPSE